MCKYHEQNAHCMDIPLWLHLPRPIGVRSQYVRSTHSENADKMREERDVQTTSSIRILACRVSCLTYMRAPTSIFTKAGHIYHDQNVRTPLLCGTVQARGGALGFTDRLRRRVKVDFTSRIRVAQQQLAQ